MKNMTGKRPCECSDDLTEVADILAAGLLRLLARKSSSLSGVDAAISLDCDGVEEGHVSRQCRDIGP